MITAKELTNGERLLMQRRREGLTLEGAAAACGVTLYRYNRWERDEEEGPRVAVGRLAFRVVSFILRRRAGASAADFARLLGVTAWWLRQMESGEASDDRLRSYWESARSAGSLRPSRAQARRRALIPHPDRRVRHRGLSGGLQAGRPCCLRGVSNWGTVWAGSPKTPTATCRAWPIQGVP